MVIGVIRSEQNNVSTHGIAAYRVEYRVIEYRHIIRHRQATSARIGKYGNIWYIGSEDSSSQTMS